MIITETAEIEINGVREVREAVFSPDKIYRYRLDICWDTGLPTLATVGLNPSTATHLKDDPTIRRGKGFAKRYGCGSYRMLNAFAYRSTDYKALFRVADPVGPENTIEFLNFWLDGTVGIACWGAHITERQWRHYYRGHYLSDAFPSLKCFRKTKSGHPEHPLYLPADLKPIPFQYD